VNSEGVGLAFETHAPVGKAAAGQFTTLKCKKAPRAPTGGISQMDIPPRWRRKRRGKRLKDEVVLDSRADADQLALVAALNVVC
jgi:hypothetical protein